MSNDIKIGVKVDSSGAKSGFKDINTSLKSLGKNGNNASKLLSKLGSSLNSVAGLGAIAATAIAGTTFALYKLNKEISKYADNIGKSAQQMNISIEFYQKLKSAAEHAGTSVTTMESAMRKMLLTMTQVDEGNKRTIDSYDKLGVKVKNSNGTFRKQEDVFKDVLISLSSMTNHTERNALAQTLLGKSADKLAPIFNEGTEAVNKYIVANESAVIVSSKLAKSSAIYNDTMQTMGEEIKKTTYEALTPFVADLSNMAVILADSDLFTVFLSGIETLANALSGLTGWVATAIKGFSITGLEKDMAKLKADEEQLVYLASEYQRYKALAAEDEVKYAGALDSANDKLKQGKNLLIEINKEKEDINRKKTILYGFKVEQAYKKSTTTTTTTNSTKEVVKLTNALSNLTDAFTLGKQSQLAYTSGMRLFQKGMGSSFNYISSISTNAFEKITNYKLGYKGLTEWLSLGEIGINDYTSSVLTLDEKIHDLNIKLNKLNTTKANLKELIKNNNNNNNNNNIINSGKIDDINYNISLVERMIKGYDFNLRALKQIGSSAREEVKNNVYSKLAVSLVNNSKDIDKSITSTIKSLSRIGSKGIKTFMTKSLGFDVSPSEIKTNFTKKVRLVQDIYSTYHTDQLNNARLHENELLYISASYSSNIINNIKSDNVIKANIYKNELNALKSKYKEEEILALNNEEKLKAIRSKYNSEKEELTQVYNAQEKASLLSHLGGVFDSVSYYANLGRDLIFSVADQILEGKQAKYDNEIKSLNDKHDAELKSFRGSDRAKEALQKKHDDEINKLSKKQAKEERDIKMKRMWIDAFINGTIAFAQAVAQLGYPAGPIVGGIMQGVMLTNAAIAQGQANKESFATGGIVGQGEGATMGPDNTVINARKGEMVLNANQQKSLFNVIAKGSADSTPNMYVTIEGDVTNDQLSKLEDMLYNLQSNGRISDRIFI